MILIVTQIYNKNLPLTVAAFALSSFLTMMTINILTSVIPLQMRNTFNSGRLAGFIDTFCYMGNAISSFGIGAFVDNWGWSKTLFVLLFIAAAVSVVLLVGSRVYSVSTE
jgi:sugar phosphate permease